MFPEQHYNTIIFLQSCSVLQVASFVVCCLSQVQHNHWPSTQEIFVAIKQLIKQSLHACLHSQHILYACVMFAWRIPALQKGV